MVQASASNRADLERAEYQVVMDALSRTPRLAKLLSFVVECYFNGRTDEITEYNIATEVFARSRTTFDATQDSIVRVEAYRLRKRLKEYYESEGREHEIALSLPAGSYVPTFVRRELPSQASEAADITASAESTDGPSSTAASEPGGAQLSRIDQAEVVPQPDSRRPGSRRPGSRKRVAVWTGLAAIAVCVLVIFVTIQPSRRHRPAQTGSAGTPAPNASPAATVTGAGDVQVPVRLLAGYEGTPRIDSAGAYWEPDHFVKGGAAYRRPDGPVARTSDPMLFEHWRTGDFQYNIPLKPGPYELHLFFIASQPEDVSLDFFHVTLNWKLLLPSFNISSDALGVNIGDERVFRDVYPTEWGYLNVGFVTERGSPSLSALELLPGLPHKQLPVRIVMQKTAVTDHQGNVWHPDNYFQNGTLSDSPRGVSGTTDPELYAHERYGHFTYSIPVDTRGRYTVVLHFAELYWGPQTSGTGGVGSRVFRVLCNGSTLLDNFDPYKEAGSLHAMTRSFSHIHPSPEGKINLTFEPIVNFATVSAIEVLDESE